MKYCPYCGKENEDNNKFCYNCGKQLDGSFVMNTPQKPVKQSNGYAIAGFILSFIIPVFGIILGALGYSKSKEMNGKGKQLSVASMVISFVVVVGVAIAGFMIRFLDFDLFY